MHQYTATHYAPLRTNRANSMLLISLLTVFAANWIVGRTIMICEVCQRSPQTTESSHQEWSRNPQTGQYCCQTGYYRDPIVHFWLGLVSPLLLARVLSYMLLELSHPMASPAGHYPVPRVHRVRALMVAPATVHPLRNHLRHSPTTITSVHLHLRW